MFALIISGCSKYDKTKGEISGRGTIINIDSSQHRILIEDYERGKIWLKLNKSDKMNNFSKGSKIVFWTNDGEIDGKNDLNEMKVLNIEKVK
jgi:hypothetical protein